MQLVYLTTALKVIFSFVVLWATARALGKKQVSQLTLFDYITGITIGSLAASAVTPQGQMGPIIWAMVLWGALSFGMHLIDLNSRKAQRFLDGHPSVLIHNGKVLEKNLRRAELTVEQMMMMLRLKGYFNVSQVEFALLETNGEVSVMPKSQVRPVTPSDLHISTSYEGLPTQVMHESKPIAEALEGLGLTEEWLSQKLQQQGARPEEVFTAWLETDGSLVIDRYGDRPH